MDFEWQKSDASFPGFGQHVLPYGYHLSAGFAPLSSKTLCVPKTTAAGLPLWAILLLLASNLLVRLSRLPASLAAYGIPPRTTPRASGSILHGFPALAALAVA